MQKTDQSADLIIYGLLASLVKAEHEYDKDTEEVHTTVTHEDSLLLVTEVTAAAGAFLEGRTLPQIFGVPERATRWMRDAFLRQHLQRADGVTSWQKACATKLQIDDFIEARLDQWLALLSRRGKRPTATQLKGWVLSALQELRESGSAWHPAPPTTWISESFWLVKASALGLPLPQSARSLYNIGTSPISLMAKRIEADF